MPKPATEAQSKLTPRPVRALAEAQDALAGRLAALEKIVAQLKAEGDEAARLEKLQDAIADLAAGHRDAHQQLDALVGAVEQLAVEQDGELPDDSVEDHQRPAAFVPPVEARGWRPRLKRQIRRVLRSTLGKLRLIWDMTHPRPPWGDDLRFKRQTTPSKEPSLSVVIPEANSERQENDTVEARLARQTVADPTPRVSARKATTGTLPSDYIWDVTPGDVTPTFLEMTQLLLTTEKLGFLCFQHGVATRSSQWIVVRDLRGAEGGIDLNALSRRAKRQPGRVLGKIVGGDPDLLPPELCQPHIRRRLLRSGDYVIAVATKPRTVVHRLAPLTSPSQSEPSPTSSETSIVLVLLTSPLAGGFERALAAQLEVLSHDHRLVVASTSPQNPWATRWRALESLTPWAYPIADVFAEQLHADVLGELIARLGVRRVLTASGPGRVPPSALLTELTRRVGDLQVAELELRPQVELEPAVSPERRERLRAELDCPPEALLVLMCADWIAEQRPEDFIALAHRLRTDHRFFFLLAGDGPLRTDVQDLARLLGPAQLRVEVTARDLEDLAAAADIVCTTAESDPFPHAVLAALCHRRPVVAAAISDAPRLLNTGPCGVLVPHPGDLDGFEAALRSLAESETRRELGDRGPEAVRQLFGDKLTETDGSS